MFDQVDLKIFSLSCAYMVSLELVTGLKPNVRVEKRASTHVKFSLSLFTDVFFRIPQAHYCRYGKIFVFGLSKQRDQRRPCLNCNHILLCSRNRISSHFFVYRSLKIREKSLLAASTGTSLAPQTNVEGSLQFRALSSHVMRLQQTFWMMRIQILRFILSILT